MDERHYREELKNVVENAPLDPGDTISHAGAYECADRVWIRRDSKSNWIPTDLGKRIYLVGPAAGLGFEHL